MGLVTSFIVSFDTGFKTLLQMHMEALDQWIKRIERASGPEDFMNPLLYNKITTQIEDAFLNDFNLIIE